MLEVFQNWCAVAAERSLRKLGRLQLYRTGNHRVGCGRGFGERERFGGMVALHSKEPRNLHEDQCFSKLMNSMSSKIVSRIDWICEPNTPQSARGTMLYSLLFIYCGIPFSLLFSLLTWTILWLDREFNGRGRGPPGLATYFSIEREFTGGTCIASVPQGLVRRVSCQCTLSPVYPCLCGVSSMNSRHLCPYCAARNLMKFDKLWHHYQPHPIPKIPKNPALPLYAVSFRSTNSLQKSTCPQFSMPLWPL